MQVKKAAAKAAAKAPAKKQLKKTASKAAPTKAGDKKKGFAIGGFPKQLKQKGNLINWIQTKPGVVVF